MYIMTTASLHREYNEDDNHVDYNDDDNSDDDSDSDEVDDELPWVAEGIERRSGEWGRCDGSYDEISQETDSLPLIVSLRLFNDCYPVD